MMSSGRRLTGFLVIGLLGGRIVVAQTQQNPHHRRRRCPSEHHPSTCGDKGLWDPCLDHGTAPGACPARCHYPSYLDHHLRHHAGPGQSCVPSMGAARRRTIPQAGAILRHGSARLHPHVSGRVGIAVDGQHNLALGGTVSDTITWDTCNYSNSCSQNLWLLGRLETADPSCSLEWPHALSAWIGSA
jgi:hypothetical protein